jgi:putative glutathione S-transferase
MVSWLMGGNGWTFDASHGSSGDALDALDYLHQRCTADDVRYSGRVTVQLWGKQQQRIICNESTEIIRMSSSAFDGLIGKGIWHKP